MIVHFLKSLGVDYDTFKNQTSIKFIYFSHYVQNWGNGNALSSLDILKVTGCIV